MANLLSMPSISVGLMGRRNQPQGNDLSFLQQLMQQSQQAAQFDAGDAYFTNPAGRPAGSGVPVLENGAVGYVPPTPSAAPAQRERVSGWRLLDRVLGGQTVTEGLDAERTRLQAQADAPQQRARIEQVLAGIEDPRERALFLGLGSDDWNKATGAQFTPQVVGGGASQVVNGRRTIEQPTFTESGDTILSRTSGGISPMYTRTDPSIAEQNVAERNRIDAIGAGQNTVGNYRIDAQGNTIFQAPDQFTLGAGDTRFTDGTPLAAGAPKERVVPDAVRRDNEKDETAISDRQATIDRVTNAIGLIDNGMINLDPASRVSAWARNRSGNSSPESRAQAELKRTVETLRNNILNDATGPQTDGDSLRALNQILDGWGDEKVVRDGLSTFVGLQTQKNETQRGIMQRRLSSYGDPAASYNGGAQSGSVARPTSAAEYQALPSGTIFEAPDGSRRRKP